MRFNNFKGFAPLTAPGTTPIFIPGSYPKTHGFQAVLAPGVTVATGKLKGTIDGVTLFDLSAASVTLTTTPTEFIVDKPVQGIAFELESLTGDSVTIYYVGR